MNQHEYFFDEDVENNYQEDRVPDVLNPFVGQDALPLPKVVFHEAIQTVHPTLQAKKRAQSIKKKMHLSISVSTSSTLALLTH
jgi:hypothetical protein